MYDVLSVALPFLFLFVLIWFILTRPSLAKVQLKRMDRQLDLMEQSVEQSAKIEKQLERIATALENRKS